MCAWNSIFKEFKLTLHREPKRRDLHIRLIYYSFIPLWWQSPPRDVIRLQYLSRNSNLLGEWGWVIFKNYRFHLILIRRWLFLIKILKKHWPRLRNQIFIRRFAKYDLIIFCSAEKQRTLPWSVFLYLSTGAVVEVLLPCYL